MFQDSTGSGGFAKTAGFPYSPVIFSAGQTIDSTSAANGFSDGYFANFFAGGFFGGAKPSIGAGSFMGFRDNYGRFGYIEVTWDNTTSEFYILSAAYESAAGVGITTPSGGGAVPEPTSGAVVDYLKLKAFRFCSDRANSQYLGRVLEISEVLTNTKFRSRFKNATESLFAC